MSLIATSLSYEMEKISKWRLFSDEELESDEGKRDPHWIDMKKNQRAYQKVWLTVLDPLSLVENAVLASRINSSIRSGDMTIVKLSFRSFAVKAPSFQIPSSLMTEAGRPCSGAIMKTLLVSKSSAIIIDSPLHIKIYRKNSINLYLFFMW
jgi:hypothetical protein